MKYVCAVLASLLWPLSLHAKEKGFVTVTLDDAAQGERTYGLAIAEEYGIVGTLFVPTELVESDSYYMSWDDVRDFVTAGWEIGSHTLTHPYLTQIRFPDATHEIIQPITDLEERLGVRPVSFAAPSGDFNDELLTEVIKPNYTYNVRAWEEGAPPDPYLIDRTNVPEGINPKKICSKIKEAGKNHTWLVLMLHNIVKEPTKEDKDETYEPTWRSILACAAKARDEGKIEVLTLKDAAARVFGK